MMDKIKVVMLLFPDLTIQDFVGPYDVFIREKNFEVLITAKSIEPIKAEGGLVLTPSVSFEHCQQADVLFIPGGRGINPLLTDDVFLNFLREQAKGARYVTSVCTGSLVLAAAGLLNGYKATTHWRSLELLKKFNVDVVEERYAIDRDRITGGGVTAGIDFGLALVAHLVSEDSAKLIQLMLEYNPLPPFQSGSPATVDEKIMDKALALTSPYFSQREKIIDSIIKKKN
jgi:cyclohexyl-isocyanide hydratase